MVLSRAVGLHAQRWAYQPISVQRTQKRAHRVANTGTFGGQGYREAKPGNGALDEFGRTGALGA